MTAARRQSNGLSSVNVPIWPMLRVPHPDNAVVEMAEAWIEGLIVDGGEFEAGGLPALLPGKVVIEEAE